MKNDDHSDEEIDSQTDIEVSVLPVNSAEVFVALEIMNVFCETNSINKDYLFFYYSKIKSIVEQNLIENRKNNQQYLIIFINCKYC